MREPMLFLTLGGSCRCLIGHVFEEPGDMLTQKCAQHNPNRDVHDHCVLGVKTGDFFGGGILSKVNPRYLCTPKLGHASPNEDLHKFEPTHNTHSCTTPLVRPFKGHVEAKKECQKGGAWGKNCV